MQTYLDCIPCFVSQALKVARLTNKEEEVHRKILGRVMGSLSKISLNATPPEIAQKVYTTIKEITRVEDPYKSAKLEQNKQAMNLYPELKEMIAVSDDPLLLSLKLAIAGNVIDLGIRKEIGDIKGEIFTTLKSPLSINHYSRFKKSLQDAKTLLYLGDNAGEIVFDKILIEEIKKRKEIKVFFVVRGAPVINDVIEDDALFVGMDEVAEVVSNGFDAPGTILAKSLPRISELVSHSDIIISKGQGNYESLSDEAKNIFFLLKAKCFVVARDLGVNEGDVILKSST